MQKRKKQPCTKQDKTIWRLKDWETVARCISAIQASKCQVSMRVCHQIAEFYCSPSIFIPCSLLNDFSDFPSITILAVYRNLQYLLSYRFIMSFPQNFFECIPCRALWVCLDTFQSELSAQLVLVYTFYQS